MSFSRSFPLVAAAAAQPPIKITTGSVLIGYLTSNLELPKDVDSVRVEWRNEAQGELSYTVALESQLGAHGILLPAVVLLDDSSVGGAVVS